MRKLLWFLVFILSITICFASGYDPSQLEEVFSDFDGIYVVEINEAIKDDVTTPNGGIATHLNVSLKVLEVLKGPKKNIEKAKYILSPCSFKTPDGLEMSVWFKIKGTGREAYLEVGETLIMYFDRYGLQPLDGIFQYRRVDPLEQKEKVLKLIAESEKEVELVSDAFDRLITFHQQYSHVFVTKEKMLDLLASIKNSIKYVEIVPVNNLYSVYFKKEKRGSPWKAKGFLLMEKPRIKSYKDKTQFLKASFDYHASAWILKHLDKPHFYSPAIAMTQVDDTWAMETGDAVMAGAGLRVTIDDDGELVKIEEIYNED